jgi:hypothetical protein
MSRGKKMKSKMKSKTSRVLDEFSAALELANAAQANAAKARAKPLRPEPRRKELLMRRSAKEKRFRSALGRKKRMRTPAPRTRGSMNLIGRFTATFEIDGCW